MKQIHILFVFCISILTSCTSNNKYEDISYPNGNVEIRIIYLQGKKSDVIEFRYAKNGQLITKQNIRNYKRHGKMFYYKNNSVSMIKNYRNDSLHGITSYYSEVHPKELSSVYFNLNGKYIAGREYMYNIDSTIYYFNSYYFMNSDTIYSEGSLSWDTHSNIIPNYSSYYLVTGIDTINKEETFNATIDFINNQDWDLRLELGEMDEDLNFINTPKIYKGHKNINISIKPTNVGDNLLMGKLYVSSDSIKNEEYVFYHEFYVKEKKES